MIYIDEGGKIFMENGKVIRVIPKKTPVTVDIETGKIIKRRVAAYARVSTDLEDQRNSFNAQLDEYRTRIGKNPDWEFVGLYSDEGITGTSTKKREGFRKMIADALAGKIDLILVKSISRFARNTVDCIATVRELRKANVEVYFDKEVISTNDKSINMMLNMWAGFAEEESRSISENVKWGVRKRMAKGQRKMITSTTIGYVTSPDGTVLIDETEKDIVKRIYNLYLFGNSLRDIATKLTEDNILTGAGKAEWNLNDVKKILTDEKYIGNFVMQKTVVKDFLDHKAYKNDGIEEKYIEENHHTPIISKQIFDIVQTLMKKKFQVDKGGKVKSNFLNGLIYCESCLRNMRTITAHPGKPYQKMRFTCKTTAKTSSIYKKCFVPSTLDYELVRLAIHDVLINHTNFPKVDIQLIKDAFLDSLRDVQNKIGGYKEKNTALESRLSELIKQAALADTLDKFNFEYTKVTKEIEFNKKEILKYENELFKAGKASDFIRGYEEYIDSKSLTYLLLKDYIGGVIRKVDGSIRIILSDKKVRIDEHTIDSLTALEPFYTNTVQINNERLNYEVVRYNQ